MLKVKRKEVKTMRDPSEVVPFIDNAVYNTREAARIIQRSERVVRRLCRLGVLAAQADHGGYFITGWRLRAYLDGRCDVCQEKFPLLAQNSLQDSN